MLTETELEDCHDFAAKLAVDAGVLLCHSAYARSVAQHTAATSLDVKDKASHVDIVTETDTRIEDFIVDRIRRIFPRHHILAEETYAAGGSKVFDLTDEPTWIVDPLDGTVNHVHLFPLVCVSIGLSVDNVPVVGAVYAPLLGGLDPLASRGCLWSACRKRGAYQSHPQTTRTSEVPLVMSLRDLEGHTRVTSQSSNDDAGPRPLRLPLAPTRELSAESPPKGLLVASEWGKDRKDVPGSNLDRKANTFLNLASEAKGRGGQGLHVHGIRSLGSAALDLVYCASGAIDVFWEGGCWEWDVCAGLAILSEAGGLYTDANAPPASAAIWKDTQATLPPASMGARRFLCIRPCSDRRGPDNKAVIETAQQAQIRIAKAIWKALHSDGLDYNREGVQYPVWQ